MTNSVKMAKLDFMSMKSQNVFLVAVAIMVFFGFMGTSVVIMCLTAAWFSALISSTIFTIQEKNDLDRLYGSISIGQKDIVLGRYIFMLAFYGVSLLIGIASYSCFALIQSKALDFLNIIPGVGLSLLIFSVIVGIQTPMFFKLGYMKAKVWSFVPFLAMMALAIIPTFVEALSGILEFLQKHENLLSVGGIVSGCIILLCSYHISITAYRKRH